MGRWKVVRERLKEVRGSDGAPASFHRFIWKLDHTGIICLPAIPYTPHTPLLFSFPPLSATHTHVAKKQLEKPGALKISQAGAVGGPYASVNIKTPQCH